MCACDGRGAGETAANGSSGKREVETEGQVEG